MILPKVFRPRAGEVQDLSKETRRAVLQNIGWLTQLGFSIACPMILCIMGALWLSRRFGLGSWVILAGVLLGLLSGISCFMNFAQAMTRRARRHPPHACEDQNRNQKPGKDA